MIANRVKITKINGGADYAKVADRLKVFWEENPNGKIDSERESLSEGKIRFVARVWRDRAELLELAKAGTSAEVIKLTANATASADAVKKGDKENEKLETVAVGRALAMLGYLASGEVASREEMEKFEDYKAQREAEATAEAVRALAEAETMDDLKDAFLNIPAEIRQKVVVVEAKDIRKQELSELAPKMPEMEAIKNAVDEIPSIRNGENK